MDLAVEKREKFGKATKSLREMGVIPAELYGHGIENLHLSVNAKEFMKIFKEAGESTLLNLIVGHERKPALIHDVQRDYLSGAVTHIDFYQVRLDQRIKARVPVEFIGEAPAVKERGGFLNKSLNEIEVEALPADLLSKLILDLSSLDDLNKSLYVRDVKVPRGVKFLVDPETVVVTVMPPLKEEEVSAPVDIGAVKVEGEEKKAERARAETEGGAEPKESVTQGKGERK